MARRNKPKREEHVPLDLNRTLGSRRVETRRGEAYIVQDIPAANAQKEYSCPGCVIPIAIGMVHLVAWREEGLFGEEAALRDRRHWHIPCWKSGR